MVDCWDEEQERIEKAFKCAEYCLDYNMSLSEIAENLHIGKTTA